MKTNRPRAGNGQALRTLLTNPMFANLARAFLLVVLTLGGYIWKTEITHLNGSVQELQHQMEINLNRQWEQMNDVRRDVTQVQHDMQTVLLRTNDHLLKLLAERNGAP
jgi:hypothetical protein